MTDTEEIDTQVTSLLDEILPRRSPQYAPAHAYLTAYLTTDAATRRLCMRALRGISPDPERTDAAAPPAAEVVSGSGDVPALAPPLPVKAVLSCGGTRCRDKGGIIIHDANDLACTRLHPGKRARA